MTGIYILFQPLKVDMDKETVVEPIGKFMSTIADIP